MGPVKAAAARTAHPIGGLEHGSHAADHTDGRRCYTRRRTVSVQSSVQPLEPGERDMVLLALAICALDRPGWFDALTRIAEKYHGRDAFLEFHQLNADRFAHRPIGR